MKGNGSRGRFIEGPDNLQQGTFATAAGPSDGDTGPHGQFQRDIVENHQRPRGGGERLMKTMNGKHVTSGRDIGGGVEIRLQCNANWLGERYGLGMGVDFAADRGGVTGRRSDASMTHIAAVAHAASSQMSHIDIEFDFVFEAERLQVIASVKRRGAS